ncbi:MAG: dihydropyrimidinase [Ignavibacteria bacterium]|nr:dihydropyrimidinase [Ignavibacteria bacterium]MBT8383820.1 dihydropyrimidinase [Ignavibacteria bacterium]MBT8391577.1 dihydropyrimidinase [Ignavibacteria bacterium]NNJ53710.1 dihydropyrimidinase [Ignavibacteriaceae bacterium]NNL20774.1 dihydropyrimidinase [Ignavibacteriaceae bacterium]
MSLLIKNGQIITAEKDFFADVYIKNEKVNLIEQNLDRDAQDIIDAKGKYVIPGGIDVHTHLDMPYGEITSSDDFETGTIAASFGGTTSIIDFATQSKGKSLQDAFNIWQKKAKGKAVIDYGFHMIITELPDSQLAEMDELINNGITSFKMFMAYPDRLMLDDNTIFKAMKQAQKNGSLILIHAENGIEIDEIVKNALAEGKTAPIFHALTRPAETEGEAVERSIELAEKSGCSLYIVHLSTNDGLEKISEARKKGFPVFAETCPQYLFLSLEDMNNQNFEDAKLIFTPPVREKWHQQKLWEGLINNQLQVVATDHCPFCFNGQKDLGKNDFTKIPSGGPGIENRMQLLFEGGVNGRRFSINRWVDLTSTTPAKLFGMYPKKGTIEIGSDADIVIWDPNKMHTISSETHHMNVDYSLYEGMKIQGSAETVISRGEIIISNNKFIGEVGRGRFIKRKKGNYNF